MICWIVFMMIKIDYIIIYLTIKVSMEDTNNTTMFYTMNDYLQPRFLRVPLNIHMNMDFDGDEINIWDYVAPPPNAD